MVVNWIFDLDNTLYDYIPNNNKRFNYNNLIYDYQKNKN